MFNKKNGIYYTPPILAEYLAQPLIRGNYQTVFDPAYGEGSLLLAAERIIKQKNNNSEIHLYGCDIKPINGLLKHLPEANLLKLDFFDYPIENKFHTILMNPPYVRHHIQSNKKIIKYKLSHQELNILSNNADLWSLFLVKAVSHLHKGGSIGAILPWAFLQADYAKSLRKWISEKFKQIKFAAISDKYFKDADERVIVLWLEGYGLKVNSIISGVSNKISDEIKFNELPIKNWLADRVQYFNAQGIDKILSKYIDKFDFHNFSNYADVKIGVVSGAVEHFIISKEKAKEYGIPNQSLIPILTKSDDFSEYINNGVKNLKLLVKLKDKDHLKYKKFIHDGIDKQYNLRAHSQNREPWYSVKIGQIPDAFFHYRIAKIPYLLPNHLNIQCTNAIHRIYFKKISSTEKKWIYVSMLSAPSQLSIEINSKTYGRGILKIEPKSLKNTLVVKRNDLSVNYVYKAIMKLFARNKKEEAMNLATEFIRNELNISIEMMSKTKSLIDALQRLRRSDKMKN